MTFSKYQTPRIVKGANTKKTLNACDQGVYKNA